MNAQEKLLEKKEALAVKKLIKLLDEQKELQKKINEQKAKITELELLRG